MNLCLALSLRLRDERRDKQEPDEADARIEPEDALTLDRLHHDREGVTGQETADAGESHGKAVRHGANVER